MYLYSDRTHAVCMYVCLDALTVGKATVNVTAN